MNYRAFSGLLLCFLICVTGCDESSSERAADSTSGQEDSAQSETMMGDTALVVDVAEVGDAVEDIFRVPDLSGPELPDGFEDPTDEVFGPDHVLEVEIEIDEAQWALLRAQSRVIGDILGADCFEGPHASPFTYVPAEVTIDGESVGLIGLRKKGFFGSLSASRPSLKIKFDEYESGGRFAGGDRMTLNNNNQDPSRLNACLANGLMRAAGVPAPRCNFAHVTVNGVSLGVYTHIEEVRRAFLGRHFDRDDGNLYEGTLSDFRQDWVLTYERKTNKSDLSRADLDAAIAALEASDDALLDAVEGVWDLDEFFTFWAMETLVAHWDGYAGNTNNHFIYHDPSRERFVFIPWGIDAAFAPPNSFFEGVSAPRSVLAHGLLARRLYLHPEGRARYLERLRILTESLWDSDALLAEVDRMQTLITPYLLPGNVGASVAVTEQTRAFIREQADVVLTDISAGGVDWTFEQRPLPCFKTVGSVSIHMTTTWGTLPVENLFSTGTGTFHVELEDSTFDPTMVGSKAGLGDSGIAEFVVAAPGEPGEFVALVINMPLGHVQTGASYMIDDEDVNAFLVSVKSNQDPNIIGSLAEGTVTVIAGGTNADDPIELQIDAALQSR